MSDGAHNYIGVGVILNLVVITLMFAHMRITVQKASKCVTNGYMIFRHLLIGHEATASRKD